MRLLMQAKEIAETTGQPVREIYQQMTLTGQHVRIGEQSLGQGGCYIYPVRGGNGEIIKKKEVSYKRLREGGCPELPQCWYWLTY
jgi:hypothetical protein